MDIAWKTLQEEHEGMVHREPEAKRVRALPNALRLDNRANGHDRRNSFRGHIKRLADLRSVSSESTCVDVLFNQTTNPDHDHVVETLKGTENSTLTKCCFQAINKAADLEKPQVGGIEPRNVRTNADEGQIINLSDFAQKDGWIKLPCSICSKLSKDQKGEMRKHDAKVKEINKKCRRGAEPLTTPLLPDPVVKSRDTAVQPCKKLRSKNLLSQMEKLLESLESDDEAETPIEEPKTEQEVDEVAHRRMPNVAFRTGSKS